MIQKIIQIYKKHEEAVNYLFFGFLGVIVSVASYSVARIWLDVTISNIVSWVIAVIFVYVTNKLFVFKSRNLKGVALIKEFCEFVGARLLTLIVETGVLLLCAELVGMNDVIAKVVAQAIIIVMNYILSKFWIFKKTNQ